MDSGAPCTIVLAGRLSESEARNLAVYCSRLRLAGQLDLVIDLAGVTSCDREGLCELYALLAGSSGARVTVRGAHWAQFLDALQEPVVGEVHEVTHQARALIGRADTSLHGAVGSPTSRVVSFIASKIERGDLAPGSRIPTMHDFAAEHDVGLDTVLRAVAILKRQGVLVAGPGGRTFVAHRSALERRD
ncbi:MAG TPA: GntR family transcriptional regulator [Actinomycetospora sp.]|jgi:hypothetical protein|uniref:GntR family transcriptional regulator n=1 Tax=Actinomycetospora sp. TaxID=1872135 RepID=UPI002F40F019